MQKEGLDPNDEECQHDECLSSYHLTFPSHTPTNASVNLDESP
jgi:hypothetical protein